jgi:hypothetical protein
LWSREIGDGHPVVAGSLLRRAETRSAGFDSPEGIARCVHVSLYKVEPSVSEIARNLLASDDRRRALLNEIVERRP